MNYFIDLFTGKSWTEFRNAGAHVSGFSEHRRSLAGQIKPGDVLLCYMTGVQRWVGALKVIGPSNDKRPIYTDSEFPVRFEVETLIALDADCGLPMSELEGKVEFYEGPKDKGKYK